LIKRKIKKFNENNWYQWGAPRNISIMQRDIGKPCIYIYNLTRKNNIAFVGKVEYFGGNLLMMVPTKECDLHKIVDYLNGELFKSNFMFSGRFKLGHRQLCQSTLPNEYL
jgi:adenine-specific DNA-methyltransferase